jgi:hypothetical protein
MKFLSKLSLIMAVFASFSFALTINRNEKANAVSIDPVNNEQSNQAKLNKLKKEIDREVGKPKAKRLSQCRVIAFGAKPCGGPKSYLIYSTLQTNENKLKRLINQYNSLEEKINKETDAMSDCMFIEEPTVNLVNGICKIK